LTGFLKVTFTYGFVEGEDFSNKRVPSIFCNILFKLWTRSIVVTPVTFSCNSSPALVFTHRLRLSFLPEILSTDIFSLGDLTGNKVNKTVVVPNKAPVKHPATIGPGIGVVRIFFAFFQMLMTILSLFRV